MEISVLVQLESLCLRNFRACRETDIAFAADLTVLVGENASGKSAVIDAIRMSTFPASGRQSAWFAADRDLSFGVERGELVEVSARFGSLSDVEKAVYIAELVDAHDDLIYTASFATAPGTPRRNVLSWSVGEARVDDAEPILRRRIAHVYLPPLRDAVRDLDGGDQSQLHDVLRILLDGDQAREDGFVDTANSALRAIADHEVARTSRDTIQAYFSQTTPPNRQHDVALNEREVELRRIARMLRIQLSESAIPIGDIASTGLGYANLLYIAMIVLQLAKAKDSDLTLLLVEEPEAHLHPQLQLVLLDFLQRQATHSGSEVSGVEPAGKVQVVVTTHSPVLASTVSIANIVVVARRSEGDHWRTGATALASIPLKATNVRKIDRYLTSTRAALLFARDVILVEGIAEALLLPALATTHLRSVSADPERARRYQRQFASATIVSVEGVDFEPYLRVLLDGDQPRVDRVVVVTDRDHTGAGDTRKAAYTELFSQAMTDGRLIVEVGGTTLEAEVFRHKENEPLLRAAFEELHPRSKDRWAAVVTAAEAGDDQYRAETFAKAIGNTISADDPHLDIGKGEFAQLVAEAADRGDTSLVVPAYLREAIEAVAHVGEGERG
ncbi:ATP-dependent endonuclease [Gordonia sp. OPL2]|uniref:ATP-dependent nuclease n=1 Tax=Gordonia sp. OPL2 TaxID=2486274 RepID=UPI001655EAA2|nr:AAA family ATPase [Gordonia sp. OPL2]RPA19878.1 ATP-dependent endonuclease [Gordonia sp. OPL2]